MGGRTLKVPSERFTRKELRELEVYPDGVERPRFRSDCADGPRPCPFVSCRYHLYLDVLTSGNIRVNHPGLEVWEIAWSCALDVAEEKGSCSLDDIGDLMNISRERVRQVEEDALTKIVASGSEVAEHEAVNPQRAERIRKRQASRAEGLLFGDIEAKIRALPERIKIAHQPVKILTRAEVESIYGRGAVHADYGQPRVAKTAEG